MSTQQVCVVNSPMHGFLTATAPAELFPSSIEEVFNRLESIEKTDELYEVGEVRPTPENIAWAKRVLLRVIPRHYLIGAEIDVFHGEIHVSWEAGNRRVVAFLPAPNALKLYCERVKEDGEVEHHLQPAPPNDPWALNGFLKWLYQ